MVCLLLISQILVRPVRCFSGRNIATSSLARQLKNSSLLPNLSDTTTASSTFEVRNPADPENEILGNVPIMTKNDVQKSIQRSSDVLESWRDGTTGQERARLLTKWSQLIEDNKQDIATIMTLESGKPLRESLGEVGYGRSFLDYAAADAVRPQGAGGGFIVPTPFTQSPTSKAPRGQVMAIQQAVGVTGLITPWNFPIAMITRKVGPALAAGCTAVVKPSELTPLTALALQTLAEEAGIPADVLITVTPDTASTPDVGHELCTNPAVQKISFTGSTAVGKQLMEWSSGTVKRLSLELGGNAPFVVFEDADLDQAAQAAIASKFRNSGQTCVCADRFLVQESVHDEFVDRFKTKVQEQLSVVGAGINEETNMGPLISSTAVKNVHQKVKTAVELEGAKLITGGSPLPSVGSHFFEPTILTHVNVNSDIWKTETFGPVAAIRSFETEEEALAIANDCRVGLASYFCTKDLSRAFRFAQKIETGLVGVNEGIMSTCVAPFGGVKESGLGREGSPLGIMEYLETKYVFLNF